MACGLAPRRGPKLRTSCGAISTFYELLEPVRHHLIRLLAALLACAPPALMLADDRPLQLLLWRLCGKPLHWLLLRWGGEHSDLHLGTPSCRPWRRAGYHYGGPELDVWWPVCACKRIGRPGIRPRLARWRHRSGSCSGSHERAHRAVCDSFHVHPGSQPGACSSTG